MGFLDLILFRRKLRRRVKQLEIALEVVKGERDHFERRYEQLTAEWRREVKKTRERGST